MEVRSEGERVEVMVRVRGKIVDKKRRKRFKAKKDDHNSHQLM